MDAPQRGEREGEPIPEIPSHVLGDDRGASAPGYKKVVKFPKKKTPPRTRYNSRKKSK
jgi:hypothetical protein